MRVDESSSSAVSSLHAENVRTCLGKGKVHDRIERGFAAGLLFYLYFVVIAEYDAASLNPSVRADAYK